MNPFQQPGAFSWQELVTPKPEAAIAFYQKLLGWTIEQESTVGVPYNTIKTEAGQPIGGIMPPPPNAPDMPATWGVYITVENVDETVEKAQILGGRILLQPIDIPTVGRFALIADPQGANFAVITYLNQE
jgi:predicted enzyme related to lactoylglutathione lyase